MRSYYYLGKVIVAGLGHRVCTSHDAGLHCTRSNPIKNRLTVNWVSTCTLTPPLHTLSILIVELVCPFVLHDIFDPDAAETNNAWWQAAKLWCDNNNNTNTKSSKLGNCQCACVWPIKWWQAINHTNSELVQYPPSERKQQHHLCST